MKAKIGKTGSGFRGALNYVFDIKKGKPGEKEARLIGGNMCGDDPKSLAKEFKTFRELRPDIKKPVWHCSLRPPEGEQISDDKWLLIGEYFMQKMGFSDKHPHVMTMHHDGGMHIVASRIALDGSLYVGKFDAKRAIRITQKLEKDFGLIRTKGLAEVEKINKKGEKYITIETPDKRRGGVDEQERYQRLGEVSPRQRLQQIIDKASVGKPNREIYEQRLKEAGVEFKANQGQTKMNGYSYQLDGIAFKASQLGKAYGWGQFQNRLDLEITREADKVRRESSAPTSPDTTATKPPITEQPPPQVETPKVESLPQSKKFLAGKVLEFLDKQFADNTISQPNMFLRMYLKRLKPGDDTELPTTKDGRLDREAIKKLAKEMTSDKNTDRGR